MPANPNLPMREAVVTPHDTLEIRFTTELNAYGLKGEYKFGEYDILFVRKGRVVGLEEGPRRTFKTQAQARAAARARVMELKTHRLYVIDVTRQNLVDGTARSCRACAIAQALWCNQERMGYSKYGFNFNVEPYNGMFGPAPRGIVLQTRLFGEEIATLGEMPMLVTKPIRRRHRKRPLKRFFRDEMVEWAINWDDWMEARQEGGIRAWRKNHGYSQHEGPYRPSPCSFVLDLDAFKPVEDAAHKMAA